MVIYLKLFFVLSILLPASLFSQNSLAVPLEQFQIDRLERTFDAIDDNKDGKYDRNEVLQSYNENVKPEVINGYNKIITYVDKNGDGIIQSNELLKNRAVFIDGYDVNGDSSVTLDEVIAGNNERLITNFIKKADKDGDGFVNFGEYLELFENNPGFMRRRWWRTVVEGEW